MKKFITCIAAALPLVLLTACEKNETVRPLQGYQSCRLESVEQGGTQTYISYDQWGRISGTQVAEYNSFDPPTVYEIKFRYLKNGILSTSQNNGRDVYYDSVILNSNNDIEYIFSRAYGDGYGQAHGLHYNQRGELIEAGSGESTVTNTYRDGDMIESVELNGTRTEYTYDLTRPSNPYEPLSSILSYGAMTGKNKHLMASYTIINDTLGVRDVHQLTSRFDEEGKMIFCADSLISSLNGAHGEYSRRSFQYSCR